MFGFKRKKDPEVFEKLPEVRDYLKALTGETMNVYVGTLVGKLMGFGKTDKDVKEAKEELLNNLQRYVKAEILLDAQNHGRAPNLEDLEHLRLK